MLDAIERYHSTIELYKKGILSKEQAIATLDGLLDVLVRVTTISENQSFECLKDIRNQICEDIRNINSENSKSGEPER